MMNGKMMERCQEMQAQKQNMQMGKESMAQCPMMKDMDEKSAGDHKMH
jgi:hypothetical protein